MAIRPIFIPDLKSSDLVRVEDVKFEWHAGMAKSRKQMSMRSLHSAAQFLYPNARLLEVSRMSDDELGECLSAFNLTFETRKTKKEISVECAFQASKVFEQGGPFTDLMAASPSEAKRDVRLKNSGRLIGFEFFGEAWPVNPPTAFYDWIYINALHRKSFLSSRVLDYDIFTDIAFNPEKSINCQANSVALYVSLSKRNLIDQALSSHEYFKYYSSKIIKNNKNQIKLL